jgi:hypothetical protein
MNLISSYVDNEEVKVYIYESDSFEFIDELQLIVL